MRCARRQWWRSPLSCEWPQSTEITQKVFHFSFNYLFQVPVAVFNPQIENFPKNFRKHENPKSPLASRGVFIFCESILSVRVSIKFVTGLGSFARLSRLISFFFVFLSLRFFLYLLCKCVIRDIRDGMCVRLPLIRFDIKHFFSSLLNMFYMCRSVHSDFCRWPSSTHFIWLYACITFRRWTQLGSMNSDLNRFEYFSFYSPLLKSERVRSATMGSNRTGHGEISLNILFTVRCIRYIFCEFCFFFLLRLTSAANKLQTKIVRKFIEIWPLPSMNMFHRRRTQKVESNNGAPTHRPCVLGLRCLLTGFCVPS